MMMPLQFGGGQYVACAMYVCHSYI